MAEIVSIGVHIWVAGRAGFPNGNPEVENNAEFVAARNNKLAKGPEKQVLLVTDNFFSDTRKVLGLGSEWNGHLIKTNIYRPWPKEMSPSELREWILKQFPADVYEFWGTELYLKDGRPYNGCVKQAKDMLRLPNSRLDVAGCLIREIPKGRNPWRALAEPISSGWSMP